MPLSRSHRILRDVLLESVVFGLLTYLLLGFFGLIDVTSIAMLYMLAVLFVAFFSSFSMAIYASILSFLLINYFFIEPRYTFRIGSFQSWVLLFTFLIVSFVVSTTIKQLKNQKLKAEQASDQAQFCRTLAEVFSLEPDSQALLDMGCKLISDKLQSPVAVIQLAAEQSAVLSRSPDFSAALNEASLKWALDSSRMIGAGTSDWPDLTQWIIPFGRFQTPPCVLVIDKPPNKNQEIDPFFISLICNQFATAYYKCLNREEALRAETRAQEETFKKTLLTSLSHDMRTPLTAILGSVNLLSESASALDSAQSAKLLESIKAESEYLIRSSENILAFAKLSAFSQNHLHLDWQSPEEIIGAVVGRYQFRADFHPIEVFLEDSGVLIKADALLLAHALANILDNAHRWRKAGTAIQIRLFKQDQQIAIAVHNQGEGFPEDFVIAPFSKGVAKSSVARGFGIGLMIVKAIMDAHHGQLLIDSNPSQSATVTILFPISHLDETK